MLRLLLCVLWSCVYIGVSPLNLPAARSQHSSPTNPPRSASSGPSSARIAPLLAEVRAARSPARGRSGAPPASRSAPGRRTPPSAPSPRPPLARCPCPPPVLCARDQMLCSSGTRDLSPPGDDALIACDCSRCPSCIICRRLDRAYIVCPKSAARARSNSARALPCHCASPCPPRKCSCSQLARSRTASAPRAFGNDDCVLRANRYRADNGTKSSTRTAAARAAKAAKRPRVDAEQAMEVDESAGPAMEVDESASLRDSFDRYPHHSRSPPLLTNMPKKRRDHESRAHLALCSRYGPRRRARMQTPPWARGLATDSCLNHVLEPRAQAVSIIFVANTQGVVEENCSSEPSMLVEHDTTLALELAARCAWSRRAVPNRPTADVTALRTCNGARPQLYIQHPARLRGVERLSRSPSLC